MGSYQCKKCDVNITYYKNISNKYSCRIHSYVDSNKHKYDYGKICYDCDAMLPHKYGNCNHKFVFKPLYKKIEFFLC